jgi:hypothetical protein
MADDHFWTNLCDYMLNAKMCFLSKIKGLWHVKVIILIRHSLLTDRSGVLRDGCRLCNEHLHWLFRKWLLLLHVHVCFYATRSSVGPTFARTRAGLYLIAFLFVLLAAILTTVCTAIFLVTQTIGNSVICLSEAVLVVLMTISDCFVHVLGVHSSSCSSKPWHYCSICWWDC